MTVDTNIIIAYLAGEAEVINYLSSWRHHGGFLFLPTIVEAEVLSFSDWTDQEQEQTKKFLFENFISIDFNRSISHLAADIRKQSKIKLPDATIATTAFFTNTPIITRNDKDFRRVDNLEIIQI